jgi:hypothetical protein
MSMPDNVGLLREFESKAEAAYDAMYDAHDPSAAGVCYSDAKEFFYEALGLARRMGAAGDVARLEARLTHVKAVYRSQFT